MRVLNDYTRFFIEIRARQRPLKYTRQSGEKRSSKAHEEYLAHIYADRDPKDHNSAQQALKDLPNERRWSILVDGFVTDDGEMIPGFGLGLLLLWTRHRQEMLYACLSKENLLTIVAGTTTQITLIPI